MKWFKKLMPAACSTALRMQDYWKKMTEDRENKSDEKGKIIRNKK
ncbi:MAG: hypothetical protein V1492_01325 [Candidatus Micrarchaeota archaeon]